MRTDLLPFPSPRESSGHIYDLCSDFISSLYISVIVKLSQSDVDSLAAGSARLGGVRLLTVHKSQGGEFRAVAVIGLNQGRFPDFRATTDGALQAELRIFYVAVTRPSRVLLLTRARTRNGRYGPYRPQPSEFVDWS